MEIPIWIPGFRGVFTYGDVSLEGEDGVNPGDPANLLLVGAILFPGYSAQPLI
ncbi:MAG: hypothetical protein KAJ16_10660 [Calditrichia bacterium]|nr:hypothetical protein [Calditrichia bacterium]